MASDKDFPRDAIIGEDLRLMAGIAPYLYVSEAVNLAVSRWVLRDEKGGCEGDESIAHLVEAVKTSQARFRPDGAKTLGKPPTPVDTDHVL